MWKEAVVAYFMALPDWLALAQQRSSEASVSYDKRSLDRESKPGPTQ
jgi:hypothetical protein